MVYVMYIRYHGMHYNVSTETTSASVLSTTTHKHTATSESTASTSVKSSGMSVESVVLYY